MVSDYFSASFPDSGMQLIDAAVDSIPNLSVITQIELLCWKTDAASEQKVGEFINDSVILNINPDVIAQCISRGKKIKTPDAIIAATAVAYNYTLITNNEKDFVGITGLKIINPYKI